MNLESIRAFVEVANVGSFQQAADNLCITQSAMSARIKGLEELLNRRLFERKRNGATLTSGGHSFHKHALRMLRSWELARQETALGQDLDGHISLGVQLNHWHAITAPWLSWMKKHSPKIATQISADYSEQLTAMVREGLLNIAIVNQPKQFPDVVIEEFSTEPLVMVSTTPRSVEKTAVEGYVFVDWGQTFRTDHGRAFPNIPNHRITVGLAAVGLEHILEQGGSGYFLASEVAKHLDEASVYLVEGAPQMQVKTYLTYLANEQDKPALQIALEGLRKINNKRQNNTQKY